MTVNSRKNRFATSRVKLKIVTVKVLSLRENLTIVNPVV